MELLSSVKRLRRVQDANGPMLECRREFKLPQQYPSTVKLLKNNSLYKEKIGRNTVSNVDKDSSDREAVSTNSIKRLRIRSEDGKDLGEIKVKFLSQDEVFKSSTITFTKSNVNKLSKHVKFSIIPPTGSEKLLNSGESKTSEKVASSDVVVTFVSDEKSEMHNKELTCMPLKKTIDDSSINNNVNNKKLLILNKSYLKKLNNVHPIHKNTLKYVKLQKNKSVMVMDAKKNGNLPIIHKYEPHNFLSKTNESNHEKCSKLKEHWQLAKSKFPIVKCEKLMISKKKANGSKLTKFPIKLDTNKLNSISTKHKLMEEKSKTKKNTCFKRLDTSNELTTIMETEPMNSVVNRICDIPIQDNDQNNENKTVERNFNNGESENCTLVSVSGKFVHDKVESIPTSVNNCISSVSEKTSNTENVKNKDSTCETDNSTNNDTSTVSNDESTTNSVYEHWNVIKEALITVKDEELRAKALQALSDCGIGTAKHVPITPPENLKTVHDSQIQTDVFGLLDQENFILVNKDKPNVERIKQKEHLVVSPEIIDLRTNWPETTINSYIDNQDLFCKQNSMLPMNGTLDLANYFNEFLGENSDANRVKRILATPHTLHRKVATQLQKDIEAMQQWDKEGMLNIHRAVMHNNSHEVQRLLLVLKASKTSIDVFTEDGMSCLELAIQSNSSRDIVQLLLEAEAQPALSELLHESAVILASKLSSPLLPDLIKYVKDRNLLNDVDSEGLAPLHYCALYGNMEGVNALIKAGVNVNLKDNRSGRTPFFHALEHNYVSIAQKLLEAGAIANLPNFAGQSVLSLIDEVKSLSLKAALKHMIF